MLPKDGRVILVESVIPADNAPGLGKIIDLEMLVMPGGKERSEEEFRELFDKSGFTLTRIVTTQSPLQRLRGSVRICNRGPGGEPGNGDRENRFSPPFSCVICQSSPSVPLDQRVEDTS